HHADEQLALLVAEGVWLTADRSRVDMYRARWEPPSDTTVRPHPMTDSAAGDQGEAEASGGGSSPWSGR
ncbi:MAG: hypothetical protein QOE24_2103, partial [Frankiales bacterium]|nr:hypothetical protein [Frankiales bacterium]